MGFNTVVLILNDHMHEVVKSPHTLAFMLCHPPSFGEDLEKFWWPQVRFVAKDHNEEWVNLYGSVKILPTFHADDKHLLIAGWNQLTRPMREEVMYKGFSKKAPTAVVKLPEWWCR